MIGRSSPIRLAVASEYPILIRGIEAVVHAHEGRLELVELEEKPVAGGVGAAEIVLCDGSSASVELAGLSEAGPKVVVFSADTRASSVSAALEAGAAGYLFQGISEDRLVDALDRVHSGERVVRLPEEVAGGSEADPRPDAVAALSAREAQMLHLVCRGLTNEEIAQLMYLSVNTVKTYIRTLYRKIDVRRRPHAVLFGVQHGFAQPSTPTTPPAEAVRSRVHVRPAVT